MRKLLRGNDYHTGNIRHRNRNNPHPFLQSTQGVRAGAASSCQTGGMLHVTHASQIQLIAHTGRPSSSKQPGGPKIHHPSGGRFAVQRQIAHCTKWVHADAP